MTNDKHGTAEKQTGCGCQSTIRDLEAVRHVIFEMESSIRHLNRGISTLLQTLPDAVGDMPPDPQSFKLLCDRLGFVADALHLAADVVTSEWATAWESVFGPEEEALAKAAQENSHERP